MYITQNPYTGEWELRLGIDPSVNASMLLWTTYSHERALKVLQACAGTPLLQLHQLDFDAIANA